MSRQHKHAERPRTPGRIGLWRSAAPQATGLKYALGSLADPERAGTPREPIRKGREPYAPLRGPVVSSVSPSTGVAYAPDLSDPTLAAVTIPEAAVLLRLSKKHCYLMTQSGAIPTVRIGERSLVVPASWLRRELQVKMREASE